MQLIRTIAKAIDGFNEYVGRGASWLALFLVLVQFVVVLLRYVFGVGSVFMQESLLYIHSALFLVAGGYTLLHDGHVRVDVFYRGASPKTKAWVNLLGSVIFLLPVTWIIWDTAWPFVSASWAIKEGSTETAGIQAVYILKSFILVFAGLIALQGVSMALHALLALFGRDIARAEPLEERI